MSLTISDKVRTEIVSHPQTVYRIVCDAFGCSTYVELTTEKGMLSSLYRSDHLTFVSSINGHPIGNCFCESIDDAVEIAEILGWQEGTKGVQYGHMYCPKHKEEA